MKGSTEETTGAGVNCNGHGDGIDPDWDIIEGGGEGLKWLDKL